jgi:hypothetical protein
MELFDGLIDYLESIPSLEAWREQKGKRGPNPVLAAIRQLIPDDH